MTREELVSRFVLNEVSDDYENFDTILAGARRSGKVCGLDLVTDEVGEALLDLIEKHLVWALTFSNKNHEVVPVAQGQVRSSLKSLYYYQTEQGKIANASLPWPLDED